MRRMRNISFLRAPGALHLLKLRLIQVGGHHARSTGGHWRRSASFQGHLQLVPGQSGAGESLLAAGTGNGARRATKAAQAQTLAPSDGCCSRRGTGGFPVGAFSLRSSKVTVVQEAAVAAVPSRCPDREREIESECDESDEGRISARDSCKRRKATESRRPATRPAV